LDSIYSAEVYNVFYHPSAYVLANFLDRHPIYVIEGKTDFLFENRDGIFTLKDPARVGYEYNDTYIGFVESTGYYVNTNK